MNNEIYLDGCINTEENHISVDDFKDKYIKWLNSNDWHFTGVIKPYKGREPEFEEE